MNGSGALLLADLPLLMVLGWSRWLVVVWPPGRLLPLHLPSQQQHSRPQVREVMETPARTPATSSLHTARSASSSSAVLSGSLSPSWSSSVTMLQVKLASNFIFTDCE